MPLLTYDEFTSGAQKGGTIREDLLDFIENLSPADTPLLNNLPQVSVNAGFVEYLEDTLRAATTNAWTEGAAATDVALTVPSRSASIVQNFQEHFHVSGRQEAVTHAGLSSMLAYQGVKAAKQLKNDIERALVLGTAASGDTDTAPAMAGILAKLVDASTATQSSGTTLTETVFNDILSLAYSYNVTLKEVYGNMNIKRTINGYTTNVTRNVDAKARWQGDLIDVYDSELGSLAIFKERYFPQSATKTAYGNDFIAIDPAYFNVGWLRPVRERVLGIDGDRERRMLVGECTLIVRSGKAGVAGQEYVARIS